MIAPTVLAIPIFLSMIIIEALYSHFTHSDEYKDTRDTASSIGVGLASIVWGALFGLATYQIYEFCYSLAPFKFPADAWWSWVLLFFADDFAYYWFHRVSHESRLFWNFHVVHHSSKRYNLSVAVRQSWFGGMVHWIFYAPLMLAGFSPWMFVTMHGLNLIYQFWIHTRFIDRLGILESVLNTPSHHRVHHGINKEYLDKNYAGVLIIWDRLFGTFSRESREPEYGILKQLETYNPVLINTHSWSETWSALKACRTVRDALRVLFLSPYLAATRSETDK